MIMVRAIVRPEKVTEVMTELAEAGYPAVTKWMSMDVVNKEVSKLVITFMTKSQKKCY